MRVDESSIPTVDFAVTTEVDNRTCIVSVQGELDVYTAPLLRERLHEVLAQGASKVVLDLHGMTFIDSTGLGVVIGALKRLRESDGDLVLRAPSRSTRKVLDITGLREILEIID